METIRILLNSGAKVNAKGGSGYTPLIHASWNGHIEAAQLLLGNGASVNEENEYGETPLHFASGNGHVTVAKLLLENGANVNSRAYVRHQKNLLQFTLELGRFACHGHSKILGINSVECNWGDVKHIKKDKHAGLSLTRR